MLGNHRMHVVRQRRDCSALRWTALLATTLPVYFLFASTRYATVRGALGLRRRRRRARHRADHRHRHRAQRRRARLRGHLRDAGRHRSASAVPAWTAWRQHALKVSHARALASRACPRSRSSRSTCGASSRRSTRRMHLAIDGLRALAPDVVGLQEVRQVPGAVPNQAETLAARARHAALLRSGDALGRRRRGAGDPVAASDRAAPRARAAARAADRAAAGARRHRRHAGRRASTSGPRTSTIASPTAASAKIRSSRSTSTSPPPSRSCRRSCAATSTPRPTATRFAFCAGCTRRRAGAPSGRTRGSARHGRADGFTWARANPYTARLRWLERDRRLDYIFVSPMKRDGRGVVHDCRIVLDRAASDGALAVGPLRPVRRGAAVGARRGRLVTKKRVTPPTATADAHLLASPAEAPKFTTTDPWRVLRIQGEFVRGFDALADIGPAVTVFGSARTPPRLGRVRSGARDRRGSSARRASPSSPAAGRGSWRRRTAARARGARRRWG